MLQLYVIEYIACERRIKSKKFWNYEANYQEIIVKTAHISRQGMAFYP